MPRGDRMGPDGKGPLTGRRMGFCQGYDQPGYLRNHERAGRPRHGAGFRGPRLWGRDPWYEDESISQKTLIENEIRILEDRLRYLQEKAAKIKDKK